MSLSSIIAHSSEQNIVVLGDSISAGYGLADESDGWVSLMQQKLDQVGLEYKVYNESISGDVTASGVGRIDGILNRLLPSWVLVELGGNDALQGKKLDHISGNLEAICRKVKAIGAKCVLLTMRIPPNFGPRYAQGFHDLYQQVARDVGGIYVPFILEGVGGNPNFMQKDGIHPNASAQPLIRDNVLNTLLGYLK